MPPQLAPGQSHTGLMPLTATGQPQDSKGHVQMAIKNNVKVFYFQDQCDVLAFLSADGRVERGALGGGMRPYSRLLPAHALGHM